jgi:hypothetical protein
MLKGQEPVVNFSAQPERGKIFDAEDTARHAVSALKCGRACLEWSSLILLAVDFRFESSCDRMRSMQV